jgi:hypothetical protein
MKANSARSAFFSLRAVVGLVLCSTGALLCLFPLTQCDRNTDRTVTIVEGISVRFPKTWAVSGLKYRNAVELITKGAKGSESAPEARTLITMERRLDHHEAVKRLAEIAFTHNGVVTYLSIGGWPAIQVRYRELLPEMGERRGPADELPQRSLSTEERMALHTTTAIAAQEAVVRLDTIVAPKANERLAREAEDIARSAILPKQSNPKITLDEVEKLRALKAPPNDNAPPSTPSPITHLSSPRVQLRETVPSTGAPALVGAASETEAGVSTSGLNMIVASNGGTNISNNAGKTFTPTATAFGFPTQGDPSIAVGKSGNFYLASLGLPATSTGSLAGCSASVISSGNNGAVFAFAGHAALCAATGTAMCFPDMEKIAADRFNASAGGGDQVYAVWRNFGVFNVLGLGLPANCNGIGLGQQTPSLACSTDSGSTWSTPLAIGHGDYPRISVGQDGFVYVVILDGQNVMVHKYTSCSNRGGGLVELTGFPKTVISGIHDPTCPLPGLDRCAESLIVPTLAVDDTNPSHLYVAVAKSASGAAANDDILVIDSVDGGLTWRAPITINSNVTGRRFMPWICTAAGNAYVGWYDRRKAAFPAAKSNDLTDYFLGSATIRNGQLLPDGEYSLTYTADPQCASGWPVPPRSAQDSE